eukprot:6006691-Pyramimonas_sp.AAC.1
MQRAGALEAVLQREVNGLLPASPLLAGEALHGGGLLHAGDPEGEGLGELLLQGLLLHLRAGPLLAQLHRVAAQLLSQALGVQLQVVRVRLLYHDLTGE